MKKGEGIKRIIFIIVGAILLLFLALALLDLLNGPGLAPGEGGDGGSGLIDFLQRLLGFDGGGEETAFIPQTCTSAVTPIARWDVVPYQGIEKGEVINLGVVAFSKNGINNVTFVITKSGSPTITKYATQMTYNPQTNVYEYWALFNATGEYSPGTANGLVTVTATVYDNCLSPNNRARVSNGNEGFEPLQLNVYPQGRTRPEIWVATSGGNDGSCAVGNSNLPCATIGGAISKINSYQGRGHVGQGIIRLKQGTHQFSGTGGAYTANAEWLTITNDPVGGGTRLNTVVIRGNNAPIISLLKFKDVTLRSSGQYNYVYTGDGNNAPIWIDNSNLIGAGYYISGGSALHSNYRKRYVTNAFVNNSDFGVGNGLLARNVTLRNLGNDPFQSFDFVLNADAAHLMNYYPNSPSGPNPIIGATYTFTNQVGNTCYGRLTKAGAFANYVHYNDVFFELRAGGIADSTSSNRYLPTINQKISNDEIELKIICSSPYGFNSNHANVDGMISSGDHIDCWQHFTPVNTIAYNYRCTDAHYQGMIVRTGNQTIGSVPTHDVAFVNVLFEAGRPPYQKINGPATLWERSVDHFLIWNSEFIGHSFNIYDDKDDDTGASFGTVVTNFDLKGNVFETLKHATPLGSVDFSSAGSNHYYIFSGAQVVTPGSASTGDAGLQSVNGNGDPTLAQGVYDQFIGKLLPSSPLRNRFSNFVTSGDILSLQRSTPETDIGSYDFEGTLSGGGGCQSDAYCEPDTACMDYSCNIGTGQCVETPINQGGSCGDSDGLYCNGGLVCNVGECVAGNPPCAEDGYSCTDECDEVNNRCYTQPDPHSERCVDGNSCTSDYCIGGGGDLNGCSFQFNSLSCDDGNACTENDQCSLGVCQQGTQVPECDVGLVLHYEMDDDPNGGAADSSGNGFNAACLSGACPTRVQDVRGDADKAYGFDGLNDRVYVADNGAYSGLSAVTLTAWVKVDSWPTSQGWRTIAGKGNWADQVEYRLRHEDGGAATGNVVWSVSSASTEGTGTIGEVSIPVPQISPGWHYFAGIWDGTTRNMALYLDGDYVGGSTTLFSTLYNGNANFAVGSSGNNAGGALDDFTGEVDDVRIYIRALSGAEILQVKNENELICIDEDFDFYFAISPSCPAGDDCDDSDALEFPGQTWYRDMDNDGYSDGVSHISCERPAGYRHSSELLLIMGDCDDSNSNVNVGLSEACFDEIDNDCDGKIDCEDGSCSPCVVRKDGKFSVRQTNESIEPLPSPPSKSRNVFAELWERIFG